MVRTLDPALTAALNSLTRSPALALTIQDHVQHYGIYQSPNGNDAWNDACIASDNSIIRSYVSRGGFASTIYVQRIIDPSQASQWQSWTALPGGSNTVFQDGGMCVSNNGGGVLRIFAQQGTGGNTLWNWYSSDNGRTWNGRGPFARLLAAHSPKVLGQPDRTMYSFSTMLLAAKTSARPSIHPPGRPSIPGACRRLQRVRA